MFLSQKLNEKWSKTVYNSIYNDFQSKNEWKMSKKNGSGIVYIIVYTIILSQKMIEK